MNVSALNPRTPASDVPIERLDHNSKLTEEEKLSEASRQFEALLLRQILQSSQNPVIKSKFTDDSTAGSIYRDMVTSQMADSMSKSGGIGLAKTFEHQLSHQIRKHSTENPPAPAPGTHPLS